MKNAVRHFFALFVFLLASVATQATTLSGTVYGGSAPLVGAAVTLNDASTGLQVGQTASDANGAYSFTVVSGTYNLVVSPPASSGFASAPVNGIVVAGADVQQSVVLVAGASRYSGVVRGLGGVVLTGLNVGAYDVSGLSEIAQSAPQPDGSFSLSLVPGDYLIKLIGGKGWKVHNADGSLSTGNWPNGAPNYFNYDFRVTVLSTDLTQDIQIPFVELRGKTTDVGGVAIGNVSLSTANASQAQSNGAYQGNWYLVHADGSAISDPSGNYSMWLLAPYPEGGPRPYKMTLSPPDGSKFANTRVADITITGGAVQTLDLALLERRTYSGVVRGLGGLVLPGMTVGAYDVSGEPQIAKSAAQADGSFSLALAPGDYLIELTGSRTWYAPNADGSWSGGTWPIGAPSDLNYAFRMTVLSSDLKQDIQVPFIELRGQTKDVNGVGVGNVSLSTTNWSQDHVDGAYLGNWYLNHSAGSTVSDTSGNYSMWLLAPYPDGGPRPYTITATPPEGSDFASTPVAEVTITGDAVQTRDFSLLQKHTYSGVVRGLGGAALPGLNVSAYDVSRQIQIAKSVPQADGSFSFALAPGDYLFELAGTRTWNLQNADGSGSTGNWPNGAPSTFSYDFRMNVLASDLRQDIQIPFVEIRGKTTDGNGVGVGKVSLSTTNLSQSYSNGAYLGTWSLQHSAGSAMSDPSGNYSMWLLAPYPDDGPRPYTITVTPPDGSGFATTPISGFTVTGSKLFTAILAFTDTTPPNIISGPTLRALTSTSAVVEWQTNEPSRGWAKAGGITVLADELSTTHSVQITGLSPSTAYSAQVSVTDATGNGPTVKSTSFSTVAGADVIPPVILEGPTVTGASSSGLVVQWTTNEPAKGVLSYGLGSALNASVSETAFSVAHRMELTGLVADSTYSVRVNATDAVGNGPTLSRVKTGRTLPAADTTAPVITNGPLVSDITDNAATVTWKTDEPSTGGVSWNDGVAYGVLSDDKLSTEHSARITGLGSAKTYHLTVSSKDALGNGPTLSKTVDFATQTTADNTAPVIVSGPTVVSITEQSAAVQWDTDEPADSQILYGLSSASALDKSDSRAPLTKKHSLPLVGLTAATAYSVQIRSQDAAGNASAYSSAVTFSTRALADTALPVFDTPPAVGYFTDNKAVIQWSTDKLTDSQVTIIPVSFDEPPRINSEGVLKDLHELSMTGLTPNKTYSATVVSTDLWGNTVTQVLGDFTTPPMPDSQAPAIIAGPSVQANANTATVTWSTDKLADSKASYGVAGAALSQVTGDIAYTQQHRVVLSKLQPSTAYQVQVASSDPSGNGPALSALVGFTTPADTGQSSTTTTTTTSTTTGGATTTTTV
ncbi:MAG: hypothetical protein WCH44_05800, partial [Betaproteobacteria bacterium]